MVMFISENGIVAVLGDEADALIASTPKGGIPCRAEGRCETGKYRPIQMETGEVLL